jgi:Xaa-Pro aminopeptidase
MPNFDQRRDRLRKLVRQSGANGILVTNESNVTYLTGFTGDDSYLLLTQSAAVVLSDPRYTTQLEEECPELDLEIRRPGATLVNSVTKVAGKAGLSQLAFEAEVVSVALLERLKDAGGRIEWVAASGLVEQLREIKDKEEIAAIRTAVALAEKAFAVARASLHGEQTEKELAGSLEHQIRVFGGDGCSFESIVAVGDRSALAHYRPGRLRVEQSNILLIDWGAVSQHYVSDLTRVLVTGRPTRKLRRVYDTVLTAQEAAILAIRPGAVMGDVDAAARNVIADAGFGPRFGHALGHGIGLDVHEQPRLAKGEKRRLRPGMVVTVEPGIYLPGWGGVRIEDDVLVTRAGHEVLSSVSKQFEQCIEV